MPKPKPNIREFPITDEIRELGFSKVQTIGKTLFVYNTRTEPIRCQYDKDDLVRTTNRLRKALCDCHEFEDKTIEKFIILLSQVWVELESSAAAAANGDKSVYEQKRAAEIEVINAEIECVRDTHAGITSEDWKNGLAERYNGLSNVVHSNIPEIWPGLEFELASLRILNIYECTLPFIGIILGRPSSYKTIVINLLRRWYCTFYTDSFSPKAWITHTTAVDSEEDLMRIDMLPKVKNKHFLTPELAPLFTIKDDDLGLVLGTITRIADGHGFGSDSGVHGHREYGDTMFVWTGAAVDIPYKVYKLLAGLGFKLYFFRLPYNEKTEAELLHHMEENFNNKKASIEDALYDYLVWFEIGPSLIHDEQTGLRKIEWDTKQDSEQAKQWIVKLAILLKHLRAIAKTWETEGSQGSDYNYSVTQPESPERAIEVLKNLARGHALLTGRNHITPEDIPIVVKTALSTGNIEKVGLFRALINKKGGLSSSEVEKSLNVSRPTALRNMTELRAIGLVEEYEVLEGKSFFKAIQLKEEFSWLYSEDFKKLRQGFEPVDNRAFLCRSEDENGDRDEDKGEFTHKENSTLYDTNPFSLEQMLTFQRIFGELETAATNDPGISKTVDRVTVSGAKLQETLVSTGKFFQNDARIIIDDMTKAEFVEKVSWDTYRRITS